MKRIFTILAAALLTSSVFLPQQAGAQSPEKMSYQAVIRNSSDNLVTNQSVGMQVSILQGSASGTAVYVETQASTTNANGLVSIEIGNGTVQSGDFATIDWVNGPYFIKTETDPAGGTSYNITGTSQLLSVPYALHAKTAETVTGDISITETDPVYTGSQAANITATNITNLSNLSGTNTGDQDLSTLATKTALSDSTAQVRSEIPDVSGFISSETDPVYSASEAANITATDITNLGNLSGTNTGDQDLSTLATKTALSDSTAQVRSDIPDVSGIATNMQAIQDTAAQIRADIPDVSGFISSETDPSVPTGTAAGQMQYWNGTVWVTVAHGYEGEVLTFVSGVPTWKTPAYDEVENPTTGKIWMNKNLGASQVATSSTDAAAYGDLYQWGRAADGHQIRTSGTTSTLSSSDTPGHGDFITSNSNPFDWRSPQNDNLWQGVSGTNNPCPSGYRLPTEAELNAERQSWSSNDAAGAFASPLKLPVAGSRYRSDGSLLNVGSLGHCWSGTVAGLASRNLGFGSIDAGMGSVSRAYGLSVRCIKD